MKGYNGILIIILATYLIILPGTSSAALVRIGWNDNTEPDLAGYKVYFGTRPSEYDYVLNVVLNNRVYLYGLQEDLTYHFAITAYDDSGNESTFSQDVQANIPHGGFPLLENIFDLELSIYNLIYNFITYIPVSSLVLEDIISGIRVEIPPYATSKSLLIAIGSVSFGLASFFLQTESENRSIEFDIAPNGFTFQKPVLIYVHFDQDRVGVQRYNEITRLWDQVDDIQSNDGVVSFSTLTLGRFKVYSLLEAEDDVRISSDGGGCFILTSASDDSSTRGSFLLILASIVLIDVSGFNRRMVVSI